MSYTSKFCKIIKKKLEEQDSFEKFDECEGDKHAAE